MSTVVYETKLVAEDLQVEIDFLSRLVGTETVATADSAIELWSGVDPGVAAMLDGAPVVSGTAVRQKVINGLPGVIYLLTLAIRTSNSSIYLNQAKIAVLSSPDVAP